MQITSNNYSVAELLGMLERRELIVNAGYQRGSGLWPDGASSYFIDTILEGFPFPKLYLFEYVDRATRSPQKEIVDGQQRINTIRRFANNEFAISGDSHYAGQRFRDLDDEAHDKFMAYTVSADVIRNARRSEILQMFRRMNAYTLPLNEAEKRHSSFQGAFKWGVNGITDNIDEFLHEYGVLTDRQIVRMADAELVAEIVLAIEQGVISTSPSDLRALYAKYDDAYPEDAHYREIIVSAVEFIVEHLSDLRRTHLMKPYALQTLIVALIHNRYGIASLQDQLQIQSLGRFARDNRQAAERLLALAQAHEAKETAGPYGIYVWGASGGTNRAQRRRARLVGVLRALGAAVPADADANLA